MFYVIIFVKFCTSETQQNFKLKLLNITKCGMAHPGSYRFWFCVPDEASKDQETLNECLVVSRGSPCL